MASARRKDFYNSYDASDADAGSYNQQSYGLGSTLGFPISENNSLNTGLDYVHNRLTNMDPELTTALPQLSGNRAQRGDERWRQRRKI